MRLQISAIGLCLTVSAACHAHDFAADTNGRTLHYDISSKTHKTVTVTYPGHISDKNNRTLTGTVEIPSKVRHGDAVYTVTAIGPKAFAGEKRLKGIVIPSGVAAIGDFAFEDCDSLASVIFPGNQVEMGEGVFFRDTDIDRVTIGSDWTEVDFSLFRWSDRLENISIPAKIGRIQGIKKLRNLKEITVDPNNRSFSSADGMLYTKDGKKLFACPREKGGAVAIKAGTETVQEGALSDCVSITSLEFPASMKSVSFRETARMKQLTDISMKSEEPLFTAYRNGEGCFLFQLANAPKAAIYVPAKAKDAYVKALPTDGGEFSPTKDGIPYMVEKNQLPEKKNIKALKK